MMQKMGPYNNRTEQQRRDARSAILTHEHSVKKLTQQIRKKLKAIEALDYGEECYDCRVGGGLIIVCKQHGDVSVKLNAANAALDSILRAWRNEDREDEGQQKQAQ